MPVMRADEKYEKRLDEKFRELVKEIVSIAKEIAEEKAKCEEEKEGIFLTVATSCIMSIIHSLSKMYRELHIMAIEGELPFKSKGKKKKGGKKSWLTRWLKGKGQKEN